MEIWLKLESLQPIGSFKVRPAFNAIAEAGVAATASGVCTASAGNFGQGLAWCCQELGVQCFVVAPDQAPETKLAAMRGYGATVVTVPYAEWWQILETRACPQAPAGAVFIHPGCENAVLAGNATVAAEILDELPDVDAIVAPYGSGALCVGIACGVRELAPPGSRCRVVAVEPDTAAPFALSMREGKPCQFEAWEPSFVDGCGGKAVLGEMWCLAQAHCPHLEGVAVPLEAIADSIRALASRNRVIAEGAGACPVAAARAGLCGGGKVVCVVSGGGIDTEALCAALRGKVPPAKGEH